MVRKESMMEKKENSLETLGSRKVKMGSRTGKKENKREKPGSKMGMLENRRGK